MRIGLIVPGGVDRSGEHRVIPAVLWILERLARRHDVHVVVPRQEPEPGEWELLGARVHNVGRGPLRAGAVRTLVRLHHDRPVDVLHALWARGPGEVALAASRLCRRPFLVHVAGGELVWLPEVGFGSRRPWRRALARLVLRRADRVTAASGPMIEIAARAGVDAVRVPLGVDTSRWTPEPPPGRPDVADGLRGTHGVRGTEGTGGTDGLRDTGPDARLPRLVQVGSLTPVKDHRTLLRAVARLEADGCPVHVDLVGEDTSEGAVPRLARELGVAHRITVHGFLPQRRAIPVVRGADLMVVASRHEAGPVAMLEAAAVGVPTVGTAVGHVRDWAPEAAVAVPVGDADALARAVAGLLSDEPRRIALAGRAREKALREDADWTAARFEELYTEVVEEGFGGGRT